MIYWFTGQPAHGKTTLAKMLYDYLVKENANNVFHVDGDDLRDLFVNKDYSINGRISNVNAAQKIAHYLHNHGKVVIVSIVSPYIDQREEFKKTIKDGMIEFYVHAERETERDANKAIAYMKPKSNYVDVDTTNASEYESFQIIVKNI